MEIGLREKCLRWRVEGGIERVERGEERKGKEDTGEVVLRLRSARPTYDYYVDICVLEKGFRRQPDRRKVK